MPCFADRSRTYGKPIEHWLKLIRQSALERHMEVVNWLKAEHGLGHGHVNALVAYARKDARA